MFVLCCRDFKSLAVSLALLRLSSSSMRDVLRECFLAGINECIHVGVTLFSRI